MTFVAGRGWVDDRTALAAALELERGFDRLAELYGSASAFDLAGWLARNGADWAQTEAWTSWHSWLHSVAFDRIELPVSRSSRPAVKAIIQAGLGRGSQAQYEQCERQALAIPLSAVEQRLLENDVGADEVPSSQDVLISIGLARDRELARAVVSVLRMTATQEEWRSIAAASQRGRDVITH